MITFMLTGGFFISVNSLPAFVQWIQYISFVRYSFTAITINEFLGQTYSCSTSGLSAYTTCQPLQIGYVRGEDVLNQVFADAGTVGSNIAISLFLLVVFRLLAYSALRYLNKPKL